jgi:hypothetical protein
LERVTIKSCLPQDGDGDWRYVLDAIRGSPNILHVKFGHIPAYWGSREYVPRWSLTVDMLDEVDVQPTTDPVEGIMRSLRLYLSRKGEWDGILEKFFAPG